MENLEPRVPTRDEVDAIDMVSFLESIEEFPIRVSYPHYWYRSPLSGKRTTNFRVQRKLNRWNDLDLNVGGTLLEFCQRYYGCTETDVLQKFIGIDQVSQKSEPSLDTERRIEQPIRNLSIHRLTARPLQLFFSSRRIHLAVAQLYCREAHYQLDGKEYYAVAFENKTGGFELQTKFFCGHHGPVDYTIVDNKAPLLIGFFDFWDFLSFLTITRGQPILPADFLILNHWSVLDTCQDVVRSHASSLLYFPHTTAGDRAVTIACGWDKSVRDQRAIYAGYPTLNQWLSYIGHREKISLFNGLPTNSSDTPRKKDPKK